MKKHIFRLVIAGFVDGESSEQVAGRYLTPIVINLPKQLKNISHRIEVEPALEEDTPNETSQDN